MLLPGGSLMDKDIPRLQIVAAGALGPDVAWSPSEKERRDHVSIFGSVEQSDPTPDAAAEPLDDEQLGREIAAKSKLGRTDGVEEIYPPGLRLGGGSWIPSSYWSADYRLRLAEGEEQGDLEAQGPLREREDDGGEERSELMLDTLFLALDDPAEPR